jgi:hypothetical protein
MVQYRVHIKKFPKNLWSFHTPVLQYPQLPVRNVFQNSLVSGIDDMLEDVAAKHGKFDVIFSDEELSVAHWEKVTLSWARGDRNDPSGGGNWYKNEAGQAGWLCSVLFDYFTPCPELLHIYVVAHDKDTERVTIRQRLEEAVSLTSRDGFGDLIPLDDDDLPLERKP